MKNKSKSKRFGLLILIGSIVSVSLFIPESYLRNKNVTLKLYGINALADTECGAGELEQLKKPKSGVLCTCEGQVIFSQYCEANGDGCSPITCDG